MHKKDAWMRKEFGRKGCALASPGGLWDTAYVRERDVGASEMSVVTTRQ